jgi:ornithine lipid ester-linked acyl 2-hydroxylase
VATATAPTPKTTVGGAPSAKAPASALWFNYNEGTFKGSEPFYFDTSNFPWVKQLESQWHVIYDELMALVKEHEDSLTPYPNREMTTKLNKWKTFGFMFWTIKSSNNCKKCPETWKLLKKIPDLLAGSFSLLEAGTTIKPHQGDTNAIIRCHLGLKIPAPAPQCAFRVGNETRSWKEGEMLMFCDAHTHTAWNNTSEKRYIMILDIMRPEYASQTKTICSRVLAAIYLEIAYQRLQFLKKYFATKKKKAFVFSTLKTLFRIGLMFGLSFSEFPS